MLFKKSFAICLLAFVLAISFCGCGELPEYFNETPEEEYEYTEDYYDRKFMDEVVTEEELRENIFSALTDININTEFIKEFKETEEGYTFVYRENTFIVTLDEDSTIASVKVGEDGEDVYLKGYEPYDAEDYMITESMIGGLKHMIANAVEISFDYPGIYEMADDWTYKHDDCYYYTKGTILIGEEKEEHSLEVITYYEEAENTMHFYSIVADEKEINLPIEFQLYEKPERKPVF